MSKPRDDRHRDLSRPPLEEISDLGHPLARWAREIDWDFLDDRFRSVCHAGPGHPPLPTRPMAGLPILKHMHNLSDEALRARWPENPYCQYFCGEDGVGAVAGYTFSLLLRWFEVLLRALIAELFKTRITTQNA
jgi:IS5 family transposase